MAIDWSYLLGYDVFISYKRGEQHSTPYARRLLASLTKADLRCFLDEHDAPVGEVLTPTLEKGLRRSRAVLIVFTDSALRSVWVRREVEAFANRGGVFIPISVGGCLESLADSSETAAEYLPRDTIFLTEASADVPSDAVIGGILARYTLRRANVFGRWLLRSAVLVLALAVVVTTIAMRAAQLGREEARVQRDHAERNRVEAVRQRDEAQRQRKTAEARYLAAEGVRELHEKRSILGLVLLVESLRLEETPEAFAALFSAMSRDPHLSMVRFDVHEAPAAVAFSDDRSLLAAGLPDGSVVVRDLRAGLGSAEKEFEAGRELIRLRGAPGPPVQIRFLDNTTVVALSSTGHWLLWQTDSPLPKRQVLLGEVVEPELEAFALAANVAVSGSYYRKPAVFDRASGDVRPLELGGCQGLEVALQGDGEVIACGEASERFRGVRLLRWRTDHKGWEFHLSFPSYPVGVAVSPRGSFVAVGDQMGAVHIWLTTDTSRPLLVLEHEGDQYKRAEADNDVDTLRISSDERLLTTRYHQTPHVWHLKSGALLAKLPTDSRAVTFSSDAQTLAFAVGSQIRLLDLRTSTLLDWACRNADRDLTPQEWPRYFPGGTVSSDLPPWALM